MGRLSCFEFTLRIVLMLSIVRANSANSTNVGAQLAIDREQVDGQSLIRMGETMNSTLLKLIGQSFINSERKMNEKICEVDSCDQWSPWSNCSAKTAYKFGFRSRSRVCWVKKHGACNRTGKQTVENDNKVCNGEMCPPSYTSYNSAYSCLKFFAATLNRSAAENLCTQDGGHILNTDTEEKWTASVAILDSKNAVTIWVDGTRTSASAKWVFLNGNDPEANGVSSKWHSTEPSNGTNDLCRVVAKSSGVYYWWDRECNQNYNFLCELRSWSFVYVLLLAVMDVQTVSLGNVCTKDEDCSSLTNSYCAKMYECTSGTCACKTGYGSTTGKDCIKKLSSYYQYCDSDYYCDGVNQTCTSGKCQCAEWNEWSDLARMCKWQEGELLTESCGPVYSRCFWQSSYGGQCSGVRAGYCGCATGTVLDISYSFVACRKPRLGEHCESSPLCESHFDTKTISDDSSNFRPTCQDNVCACPKSHELVSVKGWKLCLSKFDDELVANGEQCKNWSQCQSRFCVKCPGASSGVCMNSTEEVVLESRSSLRMSSIEQIAVMTLILLCNIS